MDFSRLEGYLDSLSGQHIPCCDLMVYQDHKLLYRHFAGYRDQEKKIPVNGNETYRLYSCSKVMTTCAALQLFEAGKMKPDDPVSLYLPAFADLKVRDGDTVRPAVNTLTIRHLMSMQGGMDYNLQSPSIQKVIEQYGRKATTRQIVDAIAQEPLCFEPGEDFQYSLCHDVLAAVVEVVSGQRFSDYLREHVWEPVGLKRTGFAFTEEMDRDMADEWRFDGFDEPLQLQPRMHLDYQLAPEYESGGAGILSCTEDYARFVDALASGGETADGKKILSPEMIDLWRTPQLCPKAWKTFDLWGRKGYTYALGVRTRVDPKNGRGGSKGEFGWDGAAGSYLFIDPDKRLSCFFAMHVRNFGYVYDVVHPTLQTLIYDALER